jgi:RNA polymerase sigma-70 factor (ECF subfamily)
MRIDTRSMNSPPASALSDEQLAVCLTPARKRGAARDAEAAFQQLYQRHARPLLAFLAGRVRRDQLDDVHQTVWLRVWERTPERIEGGNFRGWLFQVARNYLIDLARRKKVEPTEETEEWQDSRAPTALDTLIAQEEPHIVGRCMKHLDEEEAGVVRGRFAGEGYEDICRRMQITAARAYKLYHEATRKLQTCVQRSTR